MFQIFYIKKKWQKVFNFFPVLRKLLQNKWEKIISDDSKKFSLVENFY